MATFQDLLDSVARVVGGTNPDTTNSPRFFSGKIAGDGTGVSNLNGCYSAPPEWVGNAPVGIILPGRFTAKLNTQGFEENIDVLRLVILVSRNDPESQMPNLAPFRDLVPAAFRAHMELFATPSTYYAFCKSGKAGSTTWGGEVFLAYEFELEVFRGEAPTYTA